MYCSRCGKQNQDEAKFQDIDCGKAKESHNMDRVYFIIHGYWI